jgi:hypothetical protein
LFKNIISLGGYSVKIGYRKPSVKKSIKARTTGRVTRAVKRQVNPIYGKKGAGWATDPKKAAYNAVYHKTTRSAIKDAGDLIRSGRDKEQSQRNQESAQNTGQALVDMADVSTGLDPSKDYVRQIPTVFAAIVVVASVLFKFSAVWGWATLIVLAVYAFLSQTVTVFEQGTTTMLKISVTDWSEYRSTRGISFWRQYKNRK